MRKPPKPTRERLLDSAEREFTQRGYSGARVDRIARAAHLNKQLLYYYFGGKRDTYIAVLTRMAEDLGAIPDPAREQPATLKEWLGQRVAVAMPDRWARWRRLLMFEALESDGRLSRRPEREQVAQHLVTQLVEFQASGRLDPSLDPRAVYLALQALVMFPGMLPQVAKLTGADLNDPAFVEGYRHVLDIVVDRLAAGTPDRPPTPPAGDPPIVAP